MCLGLWHISRGHRQVTRAELAVIVLQMSESRTVFSLRGHQIRIPLQPLGWGLGAVVALLLLTGILISQREDARQRWSVFLSAKPADGVEVFVGKGCINCHAVNGAGGKVGPDLGRRQADRASLAQLITAMWNHAPRMWDRMRSQNVAYPSLTYEETARLVAFLYMARHFDAPGDIQHGQELFRSRGCVRCHAINHVGGAIGPDLASVADTDSPVIFAQELWNHASGMQAQMEKAGIQWPKFESHDLNDIYAYVRSNNVGTATATTKFSGDPERGWKLFQAKSCIGCHSVKENDVRVGPNLGPDRKLPATFGDVGGLMLSHSPQMQRAMKAREVSQPQFASGEMTDLITFLYSLHYTEPTGSPHVGESVFAWRGCSRCHGEEATGTKVAPALRGRGQNYNSISLATAMWRHGNRMYRQAQKMGFNWPTLVESDIGDLLAFLNSPLERSLAAQTTPNLSGK
jgi:cytochrome c2